MMSAIQLVIVACVTNQPAECRNWPVTFMEPGLTARRCIMGAQPFMAEWAGEHPNWTIKKWWCTTLQEARNEL